MNNINSADMTFVIFSAALVMLMVPGLALFYGGLVKSKNVLSTTMHSYVALFIVSILWIVVGYSLAFGPDFHGLIGGLDWSFLKNVGLEPNADYAATIPHLLFVIFQMMFAIITAAVISGSLAERVRFPAFILLVILWSTFVYSPIAHWVWGTGGWLKNLGVLDFAGGNVVEINSGISGLICAIVIGKRKKAQPDPHHIPMAVLGGGLLWFGWFGFNAGSALTSGPLAVHALLTTNTSAAAALLSWMLVEQVKQGKPTLLGASTGAVVGLVAITPGAGFVPIWASIIIGLVVSPICFFFMSVVKGKFKYDDALDAFGCHGIGGIWGGIATGIFASQSVNSALPGNGLIFGEGKLFIAQILSILITIAIASIATFIIIKVISLFMEIRVSANDEANGLDLSEHNETAYPSFTGLD